jgi:predicted metal-binding protein
MPGILDCGDCPGPAIVTRLAQVKLWNKPMEENVTKVYIGPCILDHCPYNEAIIRKNQGKGPFGLFSLNSHHAI